MGKWFVNIKNQAEGPFDEAMLLEMIGKGLEPGTQVCANGTKDWIRADALPFFGEAQSQSTPRPIPRAADPGRTATVHMITGIIAAVSPIIIGVFGYLLHKQAEQQGATMAAMSAQLGELSAVVSFGETSSWLDAKVVPHNCVANNNEASCTFLNQRTIPITTCARATIAKKEAAGVKLESMPMCTGRLGPRETKTVSAPWVGGFAKDVCSSNGRFGEVLDWSACNFTTDGVDLAEKAAPLPSSAVPQPPAKK